MYRVCKVDGIEYTFVRSMSYTKNNWRRIVKMLDFPLYCVRTMNALYKAEEGPEVIYASSPMPLVGVAAFRWAKKHDISVVFEVRDLWPKSIVDHSRLTDRNVVICALYRIEYALYCRADRVIFTMAGRRIWRIGAGLRKCRRSTSSISTRGWICKNLRITPRSLFMTTPI